MPAAMVILMAAVAAFSQSVRFQGEVTPVDSLVTAVKTLTSCFERFDDYTDLTTVFQLLTVDYMNILPFDR